MSVEKINRKEVNGKIYELVRFPGDSSFAIFEIKNNIATIENWPRIASFSDEKKAEDFFENLGN